MNPIAPDVENKIYRMSPTTTGGKLINELKTSKMKLLPWKSQIASFEDMSIEINVSCPNHNIFRGNNIF